MDGSPPSRAFCSSARQLLCCCRSSSDAADLYSQTRGKALGGIDIVKSPQENNGCRARSRPRDTSRPDRNPLRCARTAAQCLDISRATPTRPCCSCPASLSLKTLPSAICLSAGQMEETQLCPARASSASRYRKKPAEHFRANRSASDIPAGRKGLSLRQSLREIHRWRCCERAAAACRKLADRNCGPLRDECWQNRATAAPYTS